MGHEPNPWSRKLWTLGLFLEVKKCGSQAQGVMYEEFCAKPNPWGWMKFELLDI